MDCSAERLPIASFVLPGVAVDDVAAILCNRYGVMVRSGVHCAEPLVRHFGQNGLVRISLGLYNTVGEVDYVGESLEKMCQLFAV
jgi:cysteine desulfurase/selenocysteine lyase